MPRWFFAAVLCAAFGLWEAGLLVAHLWLAAATYAAGLTASLLTWSFRHRMRRAELFSLFHR